MKQTYEPKVFRGDTLALIEQANSIIGEYQAQGYSLTLRQLYYQFVARDLIENTQQSYNRIGKVISNARLAGLIDWAVIVDRTRELRTNPHWQGVSDIMQFMAKQYRRNLWKGQEMAVEVWIEKDALIGVIEDTCQELDTPYFACRGYVSGSELWRAGKRALARWQTDQQQTVIIHLGDHDPSGLDMTRDNFHRLDLFADRQSIVTLKRIALNWAQIEQYQPPPNFAKVTDTRAAEYMKQYGPNSWELDAMEPSLIKQLIRDEVGCHVDTEIMETVREQQEAERLEILDMVNRKLKP